MAHVSIRDLRNRGGDVLDRVARGERVTITRDGRPVAELTALPPPARPTRLLIEQWSRLPAMNPEKLRGELDAVIDADV